MRDASLAPRRHSRHTLLLILLASLSTALPSPVLAEPAGPGIYHSWIMRGQILSVDAGTGTGIVCIGKRDKARVGDILTIVRQTPVTTGGPRATGFRPVEIGQLRLTRIVDEHYSEYQVIRGEPLVHDTVELERR